MSGEVSLLCQVGRERMQVTGGSQMVYVLVEARPNESAAQVRMPLNFALVLDHSGSMKGAKLKAVKEAVKLVMDQLDPTDFVSVVGLRRQRAGGHPRAARHQQGRASSAGGRHPRRWRHRDVAGHERWADRATPQRHAQHGQPHDPADRRRDLWRRRPLPPHRRRRGRLGHRHLSAGHRRRLG